MEVSPWGVRHADLFQGMIVIDRDGWIQGEKQDMVVAF